jgi:hypothetical protein
MRNPTIDPENGDWRKIAEQASAETNPSKMTILVRELSAALDREESASLQLQRPRSANIGT